MLFAPFVPLAALAEWEKVNLNPPAEVLFGRFSLSSLSLAEGQTLPHLGISCTPRSTIHITVQSQGESQQVLCFQFCCNSQLPNRAPPEPSSSKPSRAWMLRARGHGSPGAHRHAQSPAFEHHLKQMRAPSGLTRYFNPKLACKDTFGSHGSITWSTLHCCCRYRAQTTG